MNAKITLIEELAMRLGMKTHPLFKKVRMIAIIGVMLFGTLTAVNKEIPNEKLGTVLKYVGIIGSSLATGMAGVSSFTIAPEERPALEEKKEEKLEEKLTK